MAQWLKEELGNFEFVASFADAALFVGVVNGERVYLVVWVDDILVAARGAERIAKVKALLKLMVGSRSVVEILVIGSYRVARHPCSSLIDGSHAS